MEPDRSSLERTFSPTPFHHATPKNVRDPLTVVPNDAAGAAANVEKEVVDLSVNSFHSAHHKDTEEGIVDRQFVPNWGLHDDLRICTFRACKELVSHLATPAEEEFLGNLMNVEVVSRAYQSLGYDAHLMELDCLRTDFQREMQANSGLSNKLSLLDATHFAYQIERIKGLEEALAPKSVQLATTEGKVKVLEDEKAILLSKLDQAEKDRYKLVRWFESGQDRGSNCRNKVAASYHLSVDDLMQISLDVPPPPPKDGVEASSVNDTGDATRKSSPAVQETPADTPFGNTT
ncbi:hypothetical protein Tco_1269747 [Tanacetum coccineum]